MYYERTQSHKNVSRLYFSSAICIVAIAGRTSLEISQTGVRLKNIPTV
jgi:hypothetical protein